MPPLIKFLLLNAAIGSGLGVAVACGLLIADIDHIWTLIRASADPWVPLVLLFVGFAVTFGSAYVGGAIMLASGKR